MGMTVCASFYYFLSASNLIQCDQEVKGGENITSERLRLLIKI